MSEGDTVLLPDGSQGEILKLPRSTGRKSPRALVRTLNSEQWLPLSSLRKVDSEAKSD